MTLPRRNVAITRAGSVIASKGVLLEMLASSAPRTVHVASGSISTQVRGLAHRDRAALVGESDDLGGPFAHYPGDAAPVEQTGLDHRLRHHRQRRLEPEHAGPGGGELDALFLLGVRGVVGGDAVDHALGQRVPQRHGVREFPQGRVHLVHRVVGLEPRVVEQQVVRGDLGADRDPEPLRPADQLDRAGGGGVADVHACFRVAGQQRVAGDDRLFGGARPTREPQPRGVRALVRDRAERQPRFLGVLRDEHAQRVGVFEGAAHHQRVVHAFAVVGEHPHPGDTGGHRAHLGELLAGQADRDRSDRVDVDQADLLPAPPHVVGDHHRVRHRVRVRHRENRRVAAECRGGGTGFDGLGVLAARFAQVRVQVDEARQQDLSRAVDHLGVGVHARPDLARSRRRRAGRRRDRPRRRAGRS